MSKVYLIKEETLRNLTDAIRIKNGTTETIPVVEAPTIVAEKPVHYVTFMNGDKTLYKKIVAQGESCSDVVTDGTINTPTKASTAQYDYTYSGWSATDGGVVDETVLQNITSDKTVYVVYSSMLRYYTVTYYDTDGTTVLYTEQVAYGVTPSYIPTKDGYFFAGWTTDLVAVTGEASYVVTWGEKLNFATASWEEIARVAENGTASQHFAVGDIRENVSLPNYTGSVMILGFDHDELADGSGTAGITFGMVGYLNYSSTQMKYATTSSSVSSSYEVYPYLKNIKMTYPKNGTAYSTTSGEKKMVAFAPRELGLSASGDNSKTYAAVSKGYYKRTVSGATAAGGQCYRVLDSDSSGKGYYVLASTGYMYSSAMSGNAFSGAKIYGRLKFCI
jgi:uncharacterized repeat protein (TIGR02543 family)